MKNIKGFKSIICAAAIAAMCVGGAMALSSCGEDDMGLEYELRYGTNGDYYAVIGIGDLEGGEIEIPSRYKGVAVEEIGAGAFSGDKKASITSVVVPDSVTTIDGFAFSNCMHMTSIDLGEGVKTIGEAAFEGCSALISITLPDSLTSLGASAFSGCSKLAELTIGSGISKIADEAFSETGFTSIVIPSTVKEIGESAFGGSVSLVDVTISDGVESIGRDAFFNCNIESVVIPASVTYIGRSCFLKRYSMNLSPLTSVEFNDPEGWTAVLENSGTGTVIDEVALTSEQVSDSAYMAEFFMDDSDAEYDGTPAYGCYTLYKD